MLMQHGSKNGNLLILVAVLTTLLGCSEANMSPLSVQKKDVVDDDIAKITAMSNIGNHTLSLIDVLTRASLYNTEVELARVKVDLSKSKKSSDYFDIYPTVVARVDTKSRSNINASTSARVLDGKSQPLQADPPYSTSSKQYSSTDGDISMTFSVLDLGLAHQRAKDNNDQIQIAIEQERQALINVQREVIRTYWYAVIAERLEIKLDILLAEAAALYSDYKALNRAKLRDSLSEQINLRDMYDIERKLRDLRYNLISARHDLDVLIGVAPGTPYKLADAKKPLNGSIIKAPKDKALEAMALFQRSELSVNLYNQRLNKSERKRLLLKLLPNVQVSAAFNFDKNPFLLNENWGSYGFSSSWAILGIFKYQSLLEQSKLQERLLVEERLKINLSVLNMLSLARARVTQGEQRLKVADKYIKVSDEILTGLTNEYNTNRISKLPLLREKMNSLISNYEREVIFAELQLAQYDLITASGLQLFPKNWRDLSDHMLKNEISKNLNVWNSTK